MFEAFNSNSGYLITFNINSNHIYYSEQNLQFYSYISYLQEVHFAYEEGLFHPYQENEDKLIRLVNKEMILNDVLQIGKLITKSIKGLEFIGLSNTSNYLFNFSPKQITGNEEIMKEIKSFVERYGFSECTLGARVNRNEMNNINDPYNGIMDSEPNINGLKLTVPNYIGLDYDKKDELDTILNTLNGVPFIQRHIIDSAINKYKAKLTFDIIPFVNLCLIMYYIKRFSYGLLKSQVSTIYKLSGVFRDLKEKYGIDKGLDKNKKPPEEMTYNGSSRRDIIKYFYYLQNISTIYMEQHFKDNNYEIPVYPNLKETLNNEDIEDSYNIGPVLRATLYIIRSPIIAAYDYLIQTLRGKNTIENMCENCGLPIYTTLKLCSDCLIKLGKQIIHNRKASGKDYKEVEDDLNNYMDECKKSIIPSSGFVINQIYINRKKSERYDQKKRDQKKEKGLL